MGATLRTKSAHPQSGWHLHLSHGTSRQLCDANQGNSCNGLRGLQSHRPYFGAWSRGLGNRTRLGSTPRSAHGTRPQPISVGPFLVTCAHHQSVLKPGREEDRMVCASASISSPLSPPPSSSSSSDASSCSWSSGPAPESAKVFFFPPRSRLAAADDDDNDDGDGAVGRFDVGGLRTAAGPTEGEAQNSTNRRSSESGPCGERTRGRRRRGRVKRVIA